MRRCISILLLLAFAGVASGALQYLHQQQHQRQAALWLAALQAAAPGHKTVPPTSPTSPTSPTPLSSSSSNCLICLLLSVPMLAQTFPAALAALLAFSLAKSLRPPIVLLAQMALPIDCRGPPRI